MAEVRLTLGAYDDLDELPQAIRARMMKLVDRLKDYPDVSGVKWLSGELAGNGRLRTGDYRLQFHVRKTKQVDEAGEEVESITVVVEKAGHRDGFYGG